MNILPFTVEHNARNVLTVRMAGGSGTDWWFLLRSDVHHDNPECDQKLERKHLDQAVERNAGIIDNGDLFCAMCGKWDNRSDKSGCRPEYQTGDYLDKLVSIAADFYKPYAGQFLVIGHGNHETSVRKHHETDLTERLVTTMNRDLKETKSKHLVQAGGYGGWVRFMFDRARWRTTRNLYRYHGTGGGGPVTRGVIQTNRIAVFTPDADIVHTGHTHDEWVVPIARHRINEVGTVFQDEQIHVRTPGYKDAWSDGYGGWEVEKMLGPKPKGSAWVHFTIRRNTVETEVLRAV